MSLLNRIVAYWYDCIKNEDILEKDISIYTRKKAVLYPFEKDSFIFNRKNKSVLASKNEKIKAFSDYVSVQGFESYYGYPVLFYFDDREKKHLIAPLFIIKVKFTEKNGKLYLQRDELIPTCGIQAFSKRGLRTEEIADLSIKLEKLFKIESSSKILKEKVLNVIYEEADFQINEPIEPDELTNSKKFSKKSAYGLYNKSLVFAGENTVFNISLLQDLIELKERYDLDKTSLSFITKQITTTEGTLERTPLLPFPANEYQVKALRDIFENDLSVITGPPGTGKSQFISNLLVNLFLEGKSVLFVSHTNEAVGVVNEKINKQFRNLMIRTGKKEFRQELKGKFNELILESERTAFTEKVDLELIKILWRTIVKNRQELIEQDRLEQKFENLYFLYSKTEKQTDSNLFFKILFSVKKYLLYLKVKSCEFKLTKLSQKKSIEEEIRESENKFYDLSRKYIRSIYAQKMLGGGNKVGKVKSFLYHVDASRVRDREIDESVFIDALDVLRIWSCTLKSLRRTFPLSPNIFDFVIFDEASQIDLPSAAPALYRAKKAIIVGDPMQLTHIAGITENIDRTIAKTHGLTENKDIYPLKVRYNDISLYKSSQHSLTHKPVLLANHYRSEEQIINLCNKVFYGGHLRIMTTLDRSRYPENLPLGVHWVNCEGEVYKHPSGSRINQTEALAVNRIFQEVLDRASETNLSIGIVTPYSRQREAIYEVVTKRTPEEVLEKHNVKILTAHKFQGSEKDIVIFSLVLASRGNAKSDSWYNFYPQILNVALSRPRYLLYIVGDKNFCQKHTCPKKNSCVLKRVVKTYDEIKRMEEIEEFTISEKFDSPTEKHLFKKLQEIDFKQYDYRLIPKLVVKRHTLDFALVGKKKINIECDGSQHEIIGGIPVVEDVERDTFLTKEGWKILRFSNHRVLSQPSAVIDKILDSL